MDPSNDPQSTLPARRLGVDSFVATLAGFTLSWFITPLDCAVMESMASHKQISITSSLKQSLKKIVTTPHRYMALPQYRLVFGTYTGTYLAKNYTDTICKATQQSPEQTAFYKFWLVFAANGGLSVFWKDPGLARITKQNIAQQLGAAAQNTAKTVAAPSMRMTYTWWVTRDVLHMIGAAVLPDYVEDKFKLSHQQWQMAQLTFPLFTQFVTTPAHLMGLDYFNHQNSDGERVKMVDRLTRVRKQYLGAVGVRMIRMWAPWSIGLLINRELRDYLNGDHHE